MQIVCIGRAAICSGSLSVSTCRKITSVATGGLEARIGTAMGRSAVQWLTDGHGKKFTDRFRPDCMSITCARSGIA